MRLPIVIQALILFSIVASAVCTAGVMGMATRKLIASCYLSAAIGTVVVHSFPALATAEMSSNKASIFRAKQAFDEVAASLSPDDVNVKDVYADLEFITKNSRLKDRLPRLVVEATTMDNRNCVEEYGKLTMEQLMTISEYFSVSNDGKTKMMISDAYPNQKLKFIRQGLSAVRITMSKVLFCAN